MTPKEADEYYINMAVLASSKGTCSRRQVGCVLVNNRDHLLSTGRNGPASGQPHCINSPCGGSNAKSGEDLDKCEAVHAEQNALLQCGKVYEIKTAYTTASPCIHCIKLLLNTSCQRVVFAEEYPHERVKEIWLNSGREWEQVVPTLVINTDNQLIWTN